MDSFQNDWNAGLVTDGNTISVPQEVLNEAKTYILNLATKANPDSFIHVAGSSMNVHDMINGLTDETLKSYMSGYPVETFDITSAPIIVTTQISTGKQCVIYGEYTTAVTDASTRRDTLVIMMNPTSTLDFNWVVYNEFINKTGSYPAIDDSTDKVCWYTNINGLSNRTYITSGSISSNAFGYPYSELNLNGHTLSGTSSYDYKFDLYVPEGAGVIITDSYGVSGSGTEVILARPTSLAEQNKFQVLDVNYNPGFTSDAETGAQALQIPLTPEVVGRLNGYLVDGTASPTDTMSTLDPAGSGVIVENPPGWLEGFLGDIWDGLANFLEWLFVPDQVVIDEFVEHCQTTLENQCGILTYPLTLVIRFLTECLDISTQDCILYIPEIKMPSGEVLYAGTEFNFTEMVNGSEFSSIYGFYKTVINYIIILGYLGLAIKKGEEMFKGGIGNDS